MLAGMAVEVERPATIEFWVQCHMCGRLELDSADFMFPIDAEIADESIELHVAFSCPRCSGWAKLYMRRVLKPLQ